MALLSTTLGAILAFRLFPPMHHWLQTHGAPGRIMIMCVLCLPTVAVLLLHRRKPS